MTSHSKNRILQVKQSSASHLKGNNVITKYFSSSPKIKVDFSFSKIKAQASKHPSTNSLHTTPTDVTEVIVLSDGDDVEQEKDDCKCNQENFEDGNKDACKANLRKTSSKPLNGFKRKRQSEMKSSSETRNLFSSMDMYLIDSNDSGPGSACLSTSGRCRPSPKSNLCKAASSSSLSAPSPSGLKRKQQLLDGFLSPKKRRLGYNESPLDRSFSTPPFINGTILQIPSSPDLQTSTSTVIDLTSEEDDMFPESNKSSCKGKLFKSFSADIAENPTSSSTLDAVRKSKSDNNFDSFDPNDVGSETDLDNMYNDLFNVLERSPRVSIDLSSDELEIPTFITSKRNGTTQLPFPRDDDAKSFVPSPEALPLVSDLESSSSSSLFHTVITSTPALPDSQSSNHSLVNKEQENCSELENTLGDSLTEFSSSQARKALERISNECVPLTPRKHKFLQDPIDFSAEEDSHEEAATPHVKTKKRVTYTLNKLLKDKKENEELKNLEVRLIEDLKKGGFGRTLNSNDSDDDELVASQDELYPKLGKIINSTEDCLGIQETKLNFHLFNRKKIFSRCCRHTVACDDKIANMFFQDLNLTSQLDFLQDHLELVLDYLESCDRDSNSEPSKLGAKLLSWLVQLLSCCFDPDLLNKIETVLVFLLDSSSRLQLDGTSCFYNSLLNLGIKSTFILTDQTGNAQRCVKCSESNLPALTPLMNVNRLLKAFLSCLSARIPVDDNELCHLLVTFLIMLAAKETEEGISLSLIYQCIEATTSAIDNWTHALYLVSQRATQLVTDLSTIHHIVTALPCNSERQQQQQERSGQLRRAIAYTALVHLLDKQSNDVEEHVKNGVEMRLVVDLASNLTVASVRSALEQENPEVSNRQGHNVLWVCVSLLHTCIRNSSKDQKKYKKDLESITESFGNLNMTIRDNGCLYCSEVKHYIRIVTALSEFQLQKIPKPQLYQQGIFKYLREASVNEEMVEVGKCDESDSRFASEEEDATALSDDPNFPPGSADIKLNSADSYVPLVDCEMIIYGADSLNPESLPLPVWNQAGDRLGFEHADSCSCDRTVVGSSSMKVKMRDQDLLTDVESRSIRFEVEALLGDVIDDVHSRLTASESPVTSEDVTSSHCADPACHLFQAERDFFSVTLNSACSTSVPQQRNAFKEIDFIRTNLGLGFSE